MKTRERWRIFVAITLILATGLIPAEPQSAYAGGNWYVATRGSDQNSCAAPQAACATIQAAVGKAASGDTVFVTADVYTGTIPGTFVVEIGYKNLVLSGGWSSDFTTQSGWSLVDGQRWRGGLAVLGDIGAPATVSVQRFIFQGAGDKPGLLNHFSTVTLETSAIRDGFGASGLFNNHGATTLINSVITHNRGACHGAGIFNESGSYLKLQHSTISDNQTASDLGCSGGGLYSRSSSIDISASVISSNTAAGHGGGIYAERQFGGSETVTIIDSVLADNRSLHGNGGGLYAHLPVSIINSTLAGNTAQQVGGGVAMDLATVRIFNATIVRNRATQGGGLAVPDYASVTIKNSLIAENAAVSSSADCAGNLTSEGYNLLQDLSGCNLAGNGTGNLTAVSPQFHPVLAEGNTYFFPSPSSPTIDAGDPANCTNDGGLPLTHDQRGIFRPLDGNLDGQSRCDIGAAEYDVDHPPPGHALFLSQINRQYCGAYSDDFANPASGWYSGDDESLHAWYADGEYHLLTKTSNLALIAAPACGQTDYTVETNARWISAGVYYGIVLGIKGNYDQFYLVGVDSQTQRLQLLFWDRTRFYELMAGSISAPAIRPNGAANHIKASWIDNVLRIELNGVLVSYLTEPHIYGLTWAGVMIMSSQDTPNAEAVFDYFKITPVTPEMMARTATQSIELDQMERQTLPTGDRFPSIFYRQPTQRP